MIVYCQHSRFLKKVYNYQVFVDNMSRGLWWIITAIMLVIFMPLGILLLGIVILREIFFMLNGNVEEEVEEEKQVKKKKYKTDEYSEEIKSEYK